MFGEQLRVLLGVPPSWTKPARGTPQSAPPSLVPLATDSSIAPAAPAAPAASAASPVARVVLGDNGRSNRTR